MASLWPFEQRKDGHAADRLAELQQVDDMNTLHEALDHAIQQQLSNVHQK
jgi:hypothetical protein